MTRSPTAQYSYRRTAGPIRAALLVALSLAGCEASSGDAWREGTDVRDRNPSISVGAQYSSDGKNTVFSDIGQGEEKPTHTEVPWTP